MIGRAVSFIKNYLYKKDRQKEIVADFHTTIIRVDDNFISSSSVILDERLIGNIYSLKEVNIAQTAEISGNITSRTCNINGKVIGDIISTESSHVKSSAIICGNIRAKSIVIEHGSNVNGLISTDVNLDENELIDKVEKKLHLKSSQEINNSTNRILKLDQAENQVFTESYSQNDAIINVKENAQLPIAENQKGVAITDPDDDIKPNINDWL
jgi:cytoskeletal protein CcmA (bactofilin family)